MKRATMLLAAVMAAGTVGVTMTAPPAEAKKSQNQDNTPGVIQKGMTLDEAQQAAGGTAAPVGGPNKGVQTYRISVRTDTGDGGVNDHPKVTVYMFGLKDGKVVWVHKQA